MFFSVDKKPV